MAVLSGDGVRLCVFGSGGVLWRGGHGEDEDEFGSAAQFAFHADVAAMRIHDMARDGEA